MEMETSVDEHHKKGRLRRKQLYNSILKQMEFYMSDSNLTKDRFFSKLLTDTEFIDLDIFLKCNKLRKITTSITDLIKAIKISDNLELSDDETKVKRKTPLKFKENADDCTIYVQNIKSDTTHEWLKYVFSEFGNVVYVSIPKYKRNNLNKGFAFIEFEHEEESKKAGEFFESISGKISSQMDPGQLCSIATFEKDGEEGKDDNKGKIDGKNKNNKKSKYNKEVIDEKSNKEKVDEKEEIEENLKRGDTEKVDEKNKSDKKIKDNKDEIDDKEKVDENSKDNKEKEDAKNNDETSSKKRKNKTVDEDMCKNTEEDKEPISKKRKKLKDGEDSNKETLKQEDTKNNEETMKKPENVKKRKREDDDKQIATEDDKEVKENINTTKAEDDTVISENKKKKTDDSDAEIGENTNEEKTDEEKKKKKKLNKRKKEIKEFGIQILTKKEWKAMRNRYLNMQKSKMKELKRHLNRKRFGNKFEDRHKMEAEQETVVTKAEKFNFTPGVIVKLKLKESYSEAKKIKNEVKTLHPDIQYVDVPVTLSNDEVFIRFSSDENAKNFAKITDKGESRILEGDEEKDYWAKIQQSKERVMTKDNRKQRGRDKLLKKAERELGKHIRFDDED